MGRVKLTTVGLQWLKLKFPPAVSCAAWSQRRYKIGKIMPPAGMLTRNSPTPTVSAALLVSSGKVQKAPGPSGPARSPLHSEPAKKGRGPPRNGLT